MSKFITILGPVTYYIAKSTSGSFNQMGLKSFSSYEEAKASQVLDGGFLGVFVNPLGLQDLDPMVGKVDRNVIGLPDKV